MAGELGKEPPTLQVFDHGIRIRNQITDLLRNTFMHLYRNSLDHGIELPEERKAKGKSTAGCIQLTVTIVNNTLLFLLRDDGKGLALGSIRKKAVERNLIAHDDVLEDEAIAKLIFAPGFSTATRVTEVSGRGVGMDAVQSFIKQEGGSIQVILTDEDEGAEYRQFMTSISLPDKYAVAPLGLPYPSNEAERGSAETHPPRSETEVDA